mgnify:FL=1
MPESLPEKEAALTRSRLIAAANDLMKFDDSSDFLIAVGTKSGINKFLAGTNKKANGKEDTPDPSRYSAVKPRFSFDQLVLPSDLIQDLNATIKAVEVEKRVFETWGLSKIEPFPRSAINFHGHPGTGKTLAAHAIADKIGKNIIQASYADIESKFHGDGPKNVKALFQAAERDSAVLFIDEADSLLSKRLTNVTQGSEQAINSMRSQLLICLEQFKGVVIFATNLVTNYDKAFETRVRHIHFSLPDESCRFKIWQCHLPEELPISRDVDVALLAKIEDVCGRDIKNAVLDAAIRAAIEGKHQISHSDLTEAVDRIKTARIKHLDEEAKDKKFLDESLASKIKNKLADKIQEPLDSKGLVHTK